MSSKGRKNTGRSTRAPAHNRNTYNKQQRRAVEIEDTAARDLKRSTDNDWTWYAQNSQLVRDYASFPYGYPLGSIVDLKDLRNDTDYAIPGVMALRFVPTVGDTNLGPDSALNIATRNIYSFVRHANSGHANYDSPDLMMYLLAMDSVHMYHAFLKRIVGVMPDYTPVNRYYPKALLSAMGVDYDDVLSNIVQLRGYVNQFAIKAGSMCIPDGMTYMKRHTWMCSGIYTDSMTTKAQTYLYTPKAFMKFTLSGTPAVSSIALKFLPKSKCTVADLIKFGNELIEPIVINEDLNIMSGDILKAYGPTGVAKLDMIGENYVVLPEYSQEVLSQIENATIVPARSGFGSSITDYLIQETAVGTGYIKYYRDINHPGLFQTPITFYGLAAATELPLVNDVAKWNLMVNSSKLVNFHLDGVTPEMAMVATRLTNVIEFTPRTNDLWAGTSGSSSGSTLKEQYQDGYMTYDCETLSSELLVQAVIFYNSRSSGGVFTLESIDVATEMFANIPAVSTPSAQVADLMADVINKLMRLSQFDWSPAATLCVGSFSKGDDPQYKEPVYYETRTLRDTDNYTILTSGNLNQLSQTAMLSMFSVPQAGR